MTFDNPPDRLRPDDAPGVTLCGYPRPGDIIWCYGVTYKMASDGYMYLWEGDDNHDIPQPSWQEKLANKLICGACFLPKFIPGHKIRGCDGRYGF